MAKYLERERIVVLGNVEKWENKHDAKKPKMNDIILLFLP